ncbi:MAG: hypothetical protein HYX75_21415 [Acidobacteria bacterium]|nr:hypothetical protein [Acidobacteriota bacterium]
MVDFRYNIIYHWGDRGMQINNGVQANIIGNLFVRGPETPSERPILHEDRSDLGTRIYMADNTDSLLGTTQSALVDTRFRDVLADRPFGTPSVTPPSEPLETIIGEWGAQPWDEVDQRIISQLRKRSGVIGRRGEIVDSLDCKKCGGKSGLVPPPASGTPSPDADNDGIPNTRDPKPKTFSAWDDTNGDGWTDLEAYLNGLPLR